MQSALSASGNTSGTATREHVATAITCSRIGIGGGSRRVSRFTESLVTVASIAKRAASSRASKKW
eukprot:scaffold98261_cov72-Phaeocystis_antarctica.AAC.3